MKIRFSTRKLEKSVQSPRLVRRDYGERSKQVIQRLEELSAVVCLRDMRSLPAAHFHELRADRIGEFAVSISRNHRIIFEPDHDPVPRLEDGGIDLARVEGIVITAIGEDYH